HVVQPTRLDGAIAKLPGTTFHRFRGGQVGKPGLKVSVLALNRRNLSTQFLDLASGHRGARGDIQIECSYHGRAHHYQWKRADPLALKTPRGLPACMTRSEE